MFTFESRHTTRFSDLDTQLHVTSITYEELAAEARFACLAANGYDLQRILADELQFIPLHSAARFHRQQMPGSQLLIRTSLQITATQELLWHQELLDKDQNLACEIRSLEVARHHQGKEAVTLWPNREASATIPAETFFYEPVPPFTHSCQQIERQFNTYPSLRNFNWVYPAAQIWRFFEDGRWNMFHQLGIDFRFINQTDTTAFFMGCNFEIRSPVQPNEPLLQKLWIERIDKIRVYLRQEVFRPGQTQAILRSREFIVFVSVSKSRPRRPAAEWIQRMFDYIEFREGIAL
ncbi:MAG: acyl-CoA thioesterase [Leptospiraceae bacterium]|nr:acyl-CoA thioesterase [Leptospiraceae bacterium]